MTYDIGQWNENGLKLEDVQRSLEYTIMEAGPSLRARVVQNGIDLKQSGFLTKLGKGQWDTAVGSFEAEDT